MSEVILYEYAKLIADSAVGVRESRAPAERTGRDYWRFVAMTYRKLIGGAISPSEIIRENKLLVAECGECAYCGAAGTLQWEHIIPISRGGPNNIDNLVLSCGACNGRKSSQNPIDWYRSRQLDRKHVPRLVMGKILKLVLEEHRRRGTLEDSEFPSGQGLSFAQVCRVFEHPNDRSPGSECAQEHNPSA